MAKKTYTYAAGKRKSASARVRLFSGRGENEVNKVPAEKYFPGKVEKVALNKPFELTESGNKYYFTARLIGSGKAAQLTALAHALSKALALAGGDKYRSPLKKAGLLTRDSRIRQRRMVGTGGKSRRAKQSPKR